MQAVTDFTPPYCDVKALTGTAVRAITSPSSITWTSLTDASLSTLDDGAGVAFRCGEDKSAITTIDLQLTYVVSDGAGADVLPRTSLSVPVQVAGTYGYLPIQTLSFLRADLLRYASWRNGQDMFFSLRARNAAGGWGGAISKPFRLDNTGPIAPSFGWRYSRPVIDGPDPYSRQIRYSGNITHVNYTAFFLDEESGLDLVEIGMNAEQVTNGVASSDGGVTNVTNVAGGSLIALNPTTVPFATLTRSPFVASVTFALPAAVTSSMSVGNFWTTYAVARAVNKQGQEVRWRSAGVFHDTTPPVCSLISAGYAQVLDGLDQQEQTWWDGPDAVAQATVGTLRGRWNCADAQSKVEHYEISAERAVSSGSGWESICKPERVIGGTDGLSFGATAGCPVVHGQKYRLRVDAFNSVGLVTTIYSNGIVIDATGPAVGSVELVPAPAGGFTSSATTLNFTVGTVSDAESRIASVSYTIGTNGQILAPPLTSPAHSLLPPPAA